MAPRLRLVLPLLTIAGCAGGEAALPAAMDAALANNQASLAAAAPGHYPPPPGAGRGVRTVAARPRAAATEDAPGTRPSTASQLLGAPPATLRRWLGEPTLRRAEGPAEVWLYSGTGCALDIVLYRAAGTAGAAGPLRVAHAAARASGAQPLTEATCLRDIGSAAAAQPVPAAETLPAAVRPDPGV